MTYRPLQLTIILMTMATHQAVVLGTDFFAVTDGDWNDPATWTPAGAPGMLDNASIGSTVPGTATTAAVTLSDDATVRFLSLGRDNGAQGALDLGEAVLNSETILVGDRGSGTFYIGSGGQVSTARTPGFFAAAVIGAFVGSEGTATVDGATSEWTMDDLTVGNEGNGALTVRNQASVSSTDWITVGATESGAGTLDIQSGGTVGNGFAIIGDRTGATGTVTVDGAGSEWNSSESLLIGRDGTGSLEITGGGRVTNGRDPAYFTAAAVGTFTGSSGQVTIDGMGSRWEVGGDEDLFVGYQGIGTMTVRNNGTATTNGRLTIGARNAGNNTLAIQSGGTVSNGFAIIGDRTGATGTVTVDGAGSEWNSSESLLIGRDGTGSLEITGGGRVTNGRDPAYFTAAAVGTFTGSSGQVTIDGMGSRWEVGGDDDLFVGNEGVGTMTVRNNGTATTNGRLTIGARNAGNNTLAIQSGGTVSNGFAAIGQQPTATGTVIVDGLASNGAASHWNNSESLVIGQLGIGTLEITGGGRVTNSRTTGYFTDAAIGSGDGSQGTVTVNGTGSEWNSAGTIVVGSSGTGTLNIVAGGRVTNGRTSGFYTAAALGSGDGSQGTVSVDGAGSEWAITGDLTVGNTGNGTLTIIGGGLVSVGGPLTIDSNLDGDSFVDMSSGGMLALLGNAAGSINDFLTLVAGTDAIRYWDNSLAQWSHITNATNGTDYTLRALTSGDLAGYTLLTVGTFPPNGDFNGDGMWTCDDIDALTAAIASGSFNLTYDMNGDAALTLSDITDPGVGWLAVGGTQNPSQTGGNPFLVGDADLNGVVDGSDFSVWNAHKFMANSAWCSGDFNADGNVDGSDFSSWNGHKFMSSTSFSSVPEPSMITVFAWALSVITYRMQARRVMS